jgi:[protein-PII] uridylyltransferase
MAADEPALRAFKDTLRAARKMRAQRFDSGVRAGVLVRAAASFTDAILARAWQRCLPPGVPASLVAVGGYGRGELHPASDIDVLILTSEQPETLAEQIESLVMFLWDIGLEVGHSVRSLAQCLDEARADVTVITNLLETRCIAGDPQLYESLCEEISPDAMWSSRDYFAAKLAEQRQRHAKFDDSGQNLEPNLKEGPGGLRDIQTIGWVAKRHFGVSTMQALVDHGFITDQEWQQLRNGEEHLWRVRYALHLLTGRHEDRLLFEHQRALAARFGYTDATANLGVEQFMQAYYRVVVQMQRLNEMLLQLFEEAILLNNELGEPEPINRRFQARSGYLEVVNPGIFARYPLAMLEMFLLLQQHPELQGVRATTIRLARAHRHLIDERFRNDIRARALFVEIFRHHDGLTHATRRMHRYGILSRYLPAFHAVMGLMQFDLFHVYTVDEHILMVIRNMRRFALDRHADECPRCNEVYARLPKPELLYLAGLFHDIAKGRGGDHSTLGARDARNFCLRHDFSTYDAELVAWLVQKHLLMSHVAQHQDIDDPDVIQDFAREVGTPTRLDYLYLLTVADMRGTNPGLWNSWKAALMDHLHTRTKEMLERGPVRILPPDDLVAERQAEARRQLVQAGFDSDRLNLLWMTLSTDYFMQNSVEAVVWHTRLLWPREPRPRSIRVALRKDRELRCTEVFIYGEDRDELFAQSTALIDQLGLNIVSARIQSTSDGLSINSYLVLEDDGEMITEPERLEGIRLYLEESLAHAELPNQPPRIPRQLKSFQMPSEVRFEQDEQRHVTLLTLKTSDRPGLLSLVGQVFADNRLRLHSARIATAGAVAQDTFAITDKRDQPVLEAAQLAHIERGIKARLDG